MERGLLEQRQEGHQAQRVAPPPRPVALLARRVRQARVAARVACAERRAARLLATPAAAGAAGARAPFIFLLHQLQALDASCAAAPRARGCSGVY